MEPTDDRRYLTDLQARAAAGERLKYVFFWGHQVPAEGVCETCFSQWYPVGFTVDGDRYATAEHYMMAAKARLFDPDAIPAILAADHPGAAKKLGRQVRDFDPDVWHRERFGVVVAASRHKFEQNPELRDYLLATGDRILVEASPRDRIWGIGLGKQNPKASDPAQWRGLNLLGFALMEARSQLA